MFKLVLSLTAFLVSLLFPGELIAAPIPAKLLGVTAKRVSAGVNIDLSFDRAMLAKNLKPAFERNFVQLVLKSTRIDSAKIIGVQESEVQKIFAYPYNPDTARVRVILKKDGNWAKGRVSIWNNNPRTIRMFVKDAEVVSSARITAPAPVAAPVSAVAKAPEPKAVAAAASQTAPLDTTPEEKTILKEVVANTRDIDINNPDSVKAAMGRQPEAAANGATGPASLGEPKDKSETSGPIGIKSDPTKHFARMAVALFGVLALFLGIVFVVKRYAGKIKNLPFGKKERLIQVVATHYLGSKKSISLVKVTGEYMVVGVSNEGISLISKLGAEVNVDKYVEDRFWGGTFEKHLDSYAKDTKIAKEVDFSEEAARAITKSYDGSKDLAPPVQSLVEQVVDKVTLSPVRASIKEKLTKLKPLA